MAKIFEMVASSQEYRDFMANVVAQANDGCQHLYTMKPGPEGEKYLLLTRCDKKDEVLKDHTVNEKMYQAWDTFVPEIAKKKEEVFFGVNSFFGSGRSLDKLFALQNLFVDLDNHSGATCDIRQAEEFVGLLVSRLEHDDLPIPYAVFTGRGIHLYWPIVPCDKSQLAHWSLLQALMGEYVQSLVDKEPWMSGWEADTQARDAARILRMPGTFNKKANRWTRFIPTEYSSPCSLDVFKEAFCVTDKDVRAMARKTRGERANIKKTFSKAERLYAEQRCLALMRLAQQRGMNLEGLRNIFTTILASFEVIAHGPEAHDRVVEFCLSLQPAQTRQEIEDTFWCCARQFYRWCDETIFTRLCMTGDEVKAFKRGIRYCSLKNIRERQQNKARNEARAKRKAAKMRLYAKIPVLFVQGMSLPAIAKTLGIGVSSVKRHLAGQLARSRHKAVIQYRKKKICAIVRAVRAAKKDPTVFIKAKRASALWPVCAGQMSSETACNLFIPSSLEVYSHRFKKVRIKSCRASLLSLPAPARPCLCSASLRAGEFSPCLSVS